MSNYFTKDAVSAAEDVGMPGLRYVQLPDTWYRARIDPKMCFDLVKGIFDKVIAALTSPLTPAEANPAQKAKVTVEQVYTVTGKDYTAALDELQQLFMREKMSDGLPIVPPTREAVAWMLSGTTRDPQEVIGTFPPKGGQATVEKIAINAVMAGARPEYLPVIIAAVEAMSDPGFDAIWWRMSTSSSVPVIIVSGPIAEELKMNSGMGLIGHGFRANATIGRAVQLTTLNMGHVWPSENDMAADGRLNPYTFYTFAENIAQSPWESYAEEKGYGSDGNVVITSVAPGGRYTDVGGGAMTPWDEDMILQLLARQMQGLFPVSNVWANVYTVVMHPECARRLAARGWSKQDVQNYLYEKSKIPYEKIETMISKEEDLFHVPYTKEELIRQNIAKGNFLPEAVPIFEEALKPGGMVPVVQTPKQIDIIVAGGEAGYTFIFGGVNPNLNHQVKPITGATLTKYGK